MVLISIALSVSLVPPQAFADREETVVFESVRSIEGSIQDVDEDRNKVVVHWMNDDVMLTYQDVTLNVTDATAILKEGENIRINDLETGDHVSVRYDANAEPLPRAISITVAET
jgi:hypothetical protein